MVKDNGKFLHFQKRIRLTSQEAGVLIVLAFILHKLPMSKAVQNARRSINQLGVED